MVDGEHVLLIDGGGGLLDRFAEFHGGDGSRLGGVSLSLETIAIVIGHGDDDDLLVSLLGLVQVDGGTHSVGRRHRFGVMKLVDTGWVMGKLVVLLLLLFYKERVPFLGATPNDTSWLFHLL